LLEKEDGRAKEIGWCIKMVFARKFPEFSFPEAVRKLMNYMLENPHFIVKPAFSEKEIITYPDLISITGLTIEDAIKLLKELVDARWVRAKISSNVPMCPKCESLKLVSHLVCPNCGDANITSGSVIKHLKCGFSGFISDFKELDEFVCPNCETKLKIDELGVTWIVPGIQYQCNNCRSFFESPKIEFECLNCRNKFSHHEAKIFSIYEYYLNPINLNIITEYTGSFTDLINALAVKGWEIAYPANLYGTAPSPHTFTFNFKYKDLINCVVDVIYSPIGFVDKTHVLNFISKIVELEVTHKLIIAVPEANQEAKETAELSGIVLIEAKTIEEVKEKIIDFLERSVEELSKEKVSAEIERISRLLEGL